jgi:hypothetical protein
MVCKSVLFSEEKTKVYSHIKVNVRITSVNGRISSIKTIQEASKKPSLVHYWIREGY